MRIIKPGVITLFVILLTVLSGANTYADDSSQKDSSTTSPLITGLIKFTAHITIPIAEIIASEAASVELNKFRTGDHDGLPVIYGPTHEATRELLEGTYYQELTSYLIDAMDRWYGGKIPNHGGLYTHYDTYRVFAVTDAFSEMTDGVDVADIIGSFTYNIRMTTDSGKITFHAINVMSLSSYAGERYLQHNMVADPVEGAFKSRVQIFQWQVDIPELSKVQ